MNLHKTHTQTVPLCPSLYVYAYTHTHVYTNVSLCVCAYAISQVIIVQLIWNMMLKILINYWD